MEPQTLNQALARATDDDQVGLRILDRRERQEWLSWPELDRRARKVAGGLAALGLERGERVALVYPTGAAFFEAFFGTLLAGGVPVPLYPPVRLGRLAEYHRRTGAMLAAVDAALVLVASRVGRLIGESISLAPPRLGCRRLAELPAGPAPEIEPSADELALVQFSSGTTVDPKPVALTHGALMAQVKAVNSFWTDDDEVRHTGVSWLPLYHDMGLIGCIFPALERPSVLTLIPPEVFVARPAIWLRAISRYRATVSPAPNFAYGLCVERVRDEELEGVDLSSWQVALNGAEAVAPGVLRKFARRFARWGFRAEALTPVYGLSEAALAVTFSDVDAFFSSRFFSRQALSQGFAVEDSTGVELVSVGRPVPGVEVEIRDDEGDRLAAGRLGRIWVQSPSLMTGYLGQPEATARVLDRGWLDTGDLGFLFAGELFLSGRAKDLVIVRGRNHSPEEIEQVASALPRVRSGCVAAVSHLPERAEREEVVLFVERRAEVGAADDGEIAEACRHVVLATVGISLDRVVVLEPGTLPRTSSGKIRRGEALRLWLAGELRPPTAVTAFSLARAMTRSWRSLARLKRKG